MKKQILSIAFFFVASMMAFAQTATLAGQINTSNGDPVGQVTVRLEDQSGALLSVTTTGASGTYSFAGLNTGNTYRVVPEKNINNLNGVSTLDIVMIARHILGIELISDPFNILAADVNGTGTITTFDIVYSRQVVLAILNAFPVASWQFWRSSVTFANPQNPFTGVSNNSFEILLTQDETGFDFIGVKTGDVNHSSDPSN